MIETKSSICDFGWPAPDFALKGVDGKTYTLADVRGPNGTLVVFSCNHCPYAVSYTHLDVYKRQMSALGTVSTMSLAAISDTAIFPHQFRDFDITLRA